MAQQGRIHEFFKRKHQDDTDLIPSPSDPKQQKIKITPHVTASLKTVKKWERDLNISLGKIADDTDVNTITEIWCATCRIYATDKSSSFVTGNKIVKKEGVQYHQKSALHIKSLAIKSATDKKARCEPTPIQESIKKMDEATFIRMERLFITAYFLAINERPFTDFSKQIELQILNGVSLGETYSNDKACKEFIGHIAGSYFDDLKKCIERSDFFSIYSDGSTDRTESEKEVIMIKIIENYYPVIKYFKLEEPDNTKAEGILSAIDKAFSDFGISDYHMKTVGYCSDGASVMMGCKKGVIKLFKDTKNAPWVLSVWCLAHRLELAVKDCFKGTYMDTLIDTLVSIYYFYKGSAKRNKEASEIAEIMEDHFLKPEKANGTRWIDHKLRAISKLLANWKIIVMHLMSYAVDNSNNEYSAKAKGILRKLQQYKLVWYMYFMKDLLNEVAKISLAFQREDVSTQSAIAKLQSSHIAIRNLMDNPGNNLQQFQVDVRENQYKEHTLLNVVNIEHLNFEKRNIVQKLMESLTDRFENIHKDPLYLACAIFDHKNWPDNSTDEQSQALLMYGNDEIKTLCQHFNVILINANCDPEKALDEWNDLKQHVSRSVHYRAVHPLSVWQRISQEDEADGRRDYVNILKVIHLTSVYPMSNASCERSFSTMKRIKSDWRCRLKTDTMDELIRISLTGPKLTEFNPKSAVQRWWLDGQKAKRPSIIPYGPRQ